MSHITTNTDIHAAIARSIDHNEIVTIRVRDHAHAQRLLEQLIAVVGDNEAYDYADADGVIEVWAYSVESKDNDTIWRVHLDYDNDRD